MNHVINLGDISYCITCILFKVLMGIEGITIQQKWQKTKTMCIYKKKTIYLIFKGYFRPFQTFSNTINDKYLYDSVANSFKNVQ